MNFARHRPWTGSVSTEALCARILVRHREAVRVRNADLAVANLARIIEATLKLSIRRGFHRRRAARPRPGVRPQHGRALFVCRQQGGAGLDDHRRSRGHSERGARAPPRGDARRSRAHLRWIIEAHVRLSEGMQPWFVFCFMEAKAFGPSERRLALDAEATTEAADRRSHRARHRRRERSRLRKRLSAALIKPLLQDWYVKRAKYRKRGTSLETYIEAVTSFTRRALHRVAAVGTKRRRA